MIKAYYTGDQELVAEFRTKGQAVNAALVKKVRDICEEIDSRAKTKLSGAKLRIISGSLLSGFGFRVEVGADRVDGIFMDTEVYAGVQEFGVYRNVVVRSHLRSQKAAFGQQMKAGPKDIFIQSYVREMNLPERSYVRSSMSEMDTIKDMLADSVAEVLH